MLSRPVFLNIFKIKLPLPGIVSFLHRVSGVLLVIAIPGIIWLLGKSLASSQDFDVISDLLHNSILIKLIMALVLWSLVHHILTGIRFLLIDAGLSLDKQANFYSSLLLIAVSISALLFFVIRVLV